MCLGSRFVEQIAKDLGGHHKNLGVGFVFDVACHNANCCIGKLALQIPKLLIGQGFDGRGIEYAPTPIERVLYLVLADQRLATARLGGH